MIRQAIQRNYHLGTSVASGARSEIYEAVRVADGAPVVIKIADLSNLSEHTFAEFANRIELCLQLRHRHLVHVIEAGVEEQARLIYLVMERIDGSSIGKYLEENQSQLTIGGVIELLRQVAAGIDALHASGVIHRDIKPDNVLITAGGIAKISDFGLALAVDEIEGKPEADVFGTPAYMAPEQIIGTSFGPSVDVYGFAMMIYVLLSRCLAFDVSTTRELVFAQIHQTPVPLRRRNRSWPHSLDKALSRSLSKDFIDRHPTARSLAEDVAKALRPFTPFWLSSYFDGSLSRFSSGEVPVDF